MRLTLNVRCLWQLGFIPRFDGYACRVALPLTVFLAVCILLSFNIHHRPAQKEEFLPTERVHYGKSLPEATETASDMNQSSYFLHYGVIIDCGSSGSRVYIYWWPPHTGKINQLLNIQPVRGLNGKPLIKKIEPGITSTVNHPSKTAEYLQPLVDYASNAIPESKHHQTPLYVLATAGVRQLSEKDQQKLLSSIRISIPRLCDFLFSETHVDVISGKQEAIYAWISINYALGQFDHDVSSNDQLTLVELPGAESVSHVRKKTVGILDMGGGSIQIAMEIPHNLCRDSAKSSVKDLMSEFSLGCTQTDLDHSYCVYVNTFLNYGSNTARKIYVERFFSNTTVLRTVNTSQGITVVSDPCLPINYREQVTSSAGGRVITLQGTGIYDDCKNKLRHLLNFSTNCTKEPCTLDGTYLPEIDFRHTRFYGFAEFYYTMEDLLHIGGEYSYRKFQTLARFCLNSLTEISIPQTGS